jgi:predicted nucleic acid-binding protein
MKIVADTNAFLAVALDHKEKGWLIEQTVGHDLVAPAVLSFEIGNALSALARRRVLCERQLAAAWDAAAAIPVELAAIDLRAALLLAGRLNIYAEDACFLQCALEAKCPLLTLDKGLKHVASGIGIKLAGQP